LRAEVLVIGGGLAGSAAAIRLAKMGRRVTLIEQSAVAHHKVCGEFLSYEALGYLRQLGLDPAELGAVKLHGVRLADKAGVVRIDLPFAAMSLTRCRLDEALLHVAVGAGVNVIRGHRVQALDRDGAGWRVWLDDDLSVDGDVAFLATGKHDLRGRPRVQGSSWKLQSGMVGFKMYFRLSPDQAESLASHVELLTYAGGYGGLQPVEGGAANLCCLVQRKRLRQIGGRWEDLLQNMQEECLHLQRRLEGAQPLLARALAISSIPYGYTRMAAEEGLWSLGDQAAVIPSFTGDGMSIALHSGCLAAEMYGEGLTSADFQTRLRSEVAGQVRLATAISRGLVWAPTRRLGLAVTQHWPGLLRTVARQTRISESARRANGRVSVPSAI
jgi:flavin-dependent dehydrogenase